jgi:hypothetical protein
VHQAAARELDSLEDLSRSIIEVELRAKTAGAMEISRRSERAPDERVQKWLDEQGQKADPESLRDSVALLGTAWSTIEERSLSDLAFEVAAFDYYVATVLDLFGDDGRLLGLLGVGSEPDRIEPKAVQVVQELAKARQQFSVSPGIAWETVDRVREAIDLSPWEDPRQAETVAL